MNLEEGASKTLHDEYVMAALTGLLAYSHVTPQHGNFHENCTIEIAVSYARAYADEAMNQRRQQQGTNAG